MVCTEGDRFRKIELNINENCKMQIEKFKLVELNC